MKNTLRLLAKMIDHSLLHPTMTDADLDEGCRLARTLDVASVCIKPYAVERAQRMLDGSDVAVCTVIGFPHGSSLVEAKIHETGLAIAQGATELDVVVNIGKVLSTDWTYVDEEVGRLNAYITSKNAIMKLIFENDYLPSDETKKRLCDACNKHDVAFAKTSTGYGFVRNEKGMYSYSGATDHDLALMRAACKPSVQIKAAGGVRTLDDLLRVQALGVTRVGATATAAILAEARK